MPREGSNDNGPRGKELVSTLASVPGGGGGQEVLLNIGVVASFEFEASFSSSSSSSLVF